eukprot:gene18612-25126_t
MEGGPQEIIPGWELGILGNGDDIPPIKEGGIRTLRIPPRLAYGEKGDGCPLGRDVACRIPPGSDVEITFSLLEADPRPPPPAPCPPPNRPLPDPDSLVKKHCGRLSQATGHSVVPRAGD